MKPTLFALSTTLFLLSAFDATAAEPAAKPLPDVKKTVDAFVGNWRYDAVVTMGSDKPIQAKLAMDCKKTAAGKAVACAFSSQSRDVPLEAGFLIGFDTFGKKVHLMGMTSDEEVHDHHCRWSDEKTLSCETLTGGLMGGEVKEDVRITQDGDSSEWDCTLVTAGGRTHFSLKGRRSK